jgi:K+-transporting ATPase KdpF subunit
VTGSEDTIMTYLAFGVAGFLFVYLFTALIRPEWF